MCRRRRGQIKRSCRLCWRKRDCSSELRSITIGEGTAVSFVTRGGFALSGVTKIDTGGEFYLFIPHAIAGWSAAKLGYQWAFIINSLSFLFSAGAIWMMKGEGFRAQRKAASASGTTHPSVGTASSTKRWRPWRRAARSQR